MITVPLHWVSTIMATSLHWVDTVDNIIEQNTTEHTIMATVPLHFADTLD